MRMRAEGSEGVPMDEQVHEEGLPGEIDPRTPLLSEDGLAHRIREERLRRGWSQEQLAKQVENILGGGFPQSAVSKIEKGKGRRSISVDEALAFSKVFEIDLLELLLPATVARTHELRDILLAMLAAKRRIHDAHQDYIAQLSRFGPLLERSPELGRGLREFTESAVIPERERVAITHLLAELYDYSGPFEGIAEPGELLPPGSTKKVIE